MYLSQTFGLSVFLMLANGIVTSMANVSMWKLLTLHEQRFLSGELGIVSVGTIGGSILTPILGAIVAAFPAEDEAYALRLGMLVPACAGLLQIGMFAALWLRWQRINRSEMDNAWNGGMHVKLVSVNQTR